MHILQGRNAVMASDYDVLKNINSEVNALPYIKDPIRYGLQEWWDRIDNKGGDCEDFALGKLNRLLKEGFKIEQLRMATCWVETGEYHAVLAVDLDNTQYVLDNRQPNVCTLEELDRIGYKPDRIQEVGGSTSWVKWLWVKGDE
jgi:predicted transglutaminase-like cysteine proteinase